MPSPPNDSILIISFAPTGKCFESTILGLGEIVASCSKCLTLSRQPFAIFHNQPVWQSRPKDPNERAKCTAMPSAIAPPAPRAQQVHKAPRTGNHQIFPFAQACRVAKPRGQTLSQARCHAEAVYLLCRNPPSSKQAWETAEDCEKVQKSASKAH